MRADPAAVLLPRVAQRVLPALEAGRGRRKPTARLNLAPAAMGVDRFEVLVNFWSGTRVQ